MGKALDDLEKYSRRPNPEVGRDFAHLEPDDVQIKLWIIRTKLGKKAEADRELGEYLAKRTGKPSIYNNNGKDVYAGIFEQDAKYLLGQITEPKLHKDNETDWYCAGMKHLLDGDREAAMDCLRHRLAPYDENARRAFTNKEIELKFPELKALAK